MTQISQQSELVVPQALFQADLKVEGFYFGNKIRMGMVSFHPYFKDEFPSVLSFGEVGLGKKQMFVDIKQELTEWKKNEEGKEC
ncbi:hypothetical protein NW48_14820 [Listeria monocytogenes]|nr:hypothetical protein [Listeria monocytogenes]EAD1931370.1 hypothetical protein [Listeria monocytogenes]EJC6456994.1 hypothetical protein [Listeria monocytogenes]HAO5780402.1 hypothetical protein [Listeria monocytogenes]HAO5784529.1 hypothetical protein [Listeria monocytogenes]